MGARRFITRAYQVVWCRWHRGTARLQEDGPPSNPPRDERAVSSAGCFESVSATYSGCTALQTWMGATGFEPTAI